MARLFIYGDYLDLVVPDSLSNDYYLGTTNGHWRGSDEQYQWGGQNFKYYGSQAYFWYCHVSDYEYNGVKQYVLDSTSTTIAESLAYLNRSNFPSVTTEDIGWWDHALAAIASEPNSIIYGGNSDDKLNWVAGHPTIYHWMVRVGLTLCRLAETKMFIHFQDLTETEV